MKERSSRPWIATVLGAFVMVADAVAFVPATGLHRPARLVPGTNVHATQHVLSSPDACPGQLCRNDPVSNFDPLGLVDQEFDLHFDPDSGMVKVIMRHCPWGQAQLSPANWTDIGQVRWRLATDAEQKFWRKRKSGDAVGATLTHLAAAGIETGYLEMLRTQGSLMAGAAGAPFGGASLLGQSFAASAAGSAVHELGGVPLGDEISVDRFLGNVALGTVGGVALGKLVSPSARLLPEWMTPDGLVLTGRGTAVPAGEFGGVGGTRVAAEGTTYRTWNQFQRGTAGQFVSRAEAAKAWSVYKDANSIITGSSRSMAARAEYLRSLADDWRTPSWQKQWLRDGRVPPGYEVDHIKPLSIGGADAPANMRFQGVDLHDMWHRQYDPWNW